MDVSAASFAGPSDPAVLRRIHELRGEVRRRDARPNDGRCGNVTTALTEEFGWQGRRGYLRLLDDTVSWVHCWNLLPDGTIVDATADQFQNLWLGDVVTVAPSSPMAEHYLHAPKEWDLRFERGSSSDAHTIRCVSGDEVHVLTPDVPERPWWSLARGVLEVLTGWELNDPLVDLAARVLRAKSATAEHLTSAELTHPLLIASIHHLGSQGTRPWIAPEFRAPV
ncbi:hypothetical protein SAMN05421678_111134 [Actinopolymorpha cephalotaxi]|uniref:Uncharacterized protein n=1 Tax=Actinopolymorpha cephalotaxi TaxID=504797 RepID=A0A1I2X0Y8_9ACTN|nr:hypothetical protein [Actinopolymorpha cephalotaxi]NYH85163.1 hypothetical protein [Actinopolymorpha cephalotaxi]SFH05611.1 hypothetical protein SAMN05421678_111134 [Actinopolymorpha cephalotaxi]